MKLRLSGLVVALAIGGLIPLGLGGCTTTAHAEDRAALLIDFGAGEEHAYCLPVGGGTTGIELLERTGVALTLQDYGGGNVTVCSIDGRGCSYPSRPCFCECERVNACTFWALYRLDEHGEWDFSDQGASIARVAPGTVHAWRWGRHDTEGGNPPKQESLRSLCARARPVAARTQKPARDGGATLGVAAVLAATIALGLWAMRIRRARGAEAP